MFTKSAHLYDAIYSFIDYKAEAKLLSSIVEQNKKSGGNQFLDVACGTGPHIEYLRDDFAVEGLDIDGPMLEIARRKNPGITFHQADMIDFDLPHAFDAIVCMFSSVGFVKTFENLRKTAACFARHMKPGAVLVIEPWVQAESFIDGHVGSRFVDLPDMKLARINTARRKENGVSHLEFHYMVGTADGVEYFSEDHELGLWSNDEYLSALRDAGLHATFQTEGPKTQELYNRGLYVAVKP